MRLRTLTCALFALAAAAACGRSGAELGPDGSPTPPGSPTASNTPTSTHRKVLTIAGGEITGSHTGFPVLVAIANDPDLRSVANAGYVADADGGDIGFTQESLTLSHEIEEYDPGTGTLVAWVRIPALVQGSNETFALELGGPIRASTALGVWGSDYEAVWHLDELADSTSHARALTENGGNATGGRISDGWAFDGVDDYLSYPAPISLSGAFTLSAWIRLDAAQADLGDFARVVERWSGSSGGYGLFFENTDNPQFGVHAADGTNQDNATPNTSFVVGEWYYVAGVWRPAPGEKALHSGVAGGSLTKSGAAEANNTNVVTPNGPVFVGGDPISVNAPFFAGRIDELRILNVARSDDWLRTEFQNQSDPGQFVGVGPLEAIP